MECEEKNLYAVQFHPEVMHTVEGTKMLSNFVYNICECSGDWKMDSFVEKTIEEIREKVGNGKALCALSGGVDSSVAAVMLSKAIGKQLTCVFVDHGLLRKNEGDEVEAIFGPEGQYDLNFIRVNAQERFYEKLAGVEDPETKRKIIGEEFIRVFEGEVKKGMTIEEARKLVLDPLYLGCLIIKSGDADGQLAGARNTTGDVLRPALQIIKTTPGITCVSGAMLLLTHAPEYGKNGILVMGDVAVTPVPDAEQLAQIAVCTARTAKSVVGMEPKVAMLSFSTKGSAKHEVVDKVIEAVKIAHEMDPDLALDGELQADAALVPEVGASKAPGSAIAGLSLIHI